MVIIIKIGIFFVWVGSYYYGYYIEGKEKNKRLLTVYVPEWNKKCNNVQQILLSYRKNLNRITISIVAIGLILIVCLPDKIGVIEALCGGIIYSIILKYLGKHYRKKLRELKKQECWECQIETEYHIDLSLNETMNHSIMKPYYFLIPICLNGMVLFFQIWKSQSSHIIGISAVFFLMICFLGYGFIYYIPNRTYCNDSEKNKKLNQNMKYYLSRFLLCISTIDGLTLIVLCSIEFLTSIQIFFVVSIAGISSLLLLYIAVQGIIKMGKMEQKDLEKEKIYEYDEDDYWNYGIFGVKYANPYDPTLLKQHNISGSCFNMGRAVSRKICFSFFTVVVIFLAYILWYPGILDAKKELAELQIEEENILIKGAYYNRKIPIDSIQTVSLLEEKISGTKVFGTATAYYASGNFKLDKIGSCKMYVATKHLPYILVSTIKGCIIFNDDEEEKTIYIYNEIQKRLENKN